VAEATELVKVRAGHVERIVLLKGTADATSSLSLTAGWGSQLPANLDIGPLKLSWTTASEPQQASSGRLNLDDHFNSSHRRGERVKSM
jgi:anaphase-promoting complex subunit 1